MLIQSISYIIRELLILLIVLNPAIVAKSIADIAKNWGVDSSKWEYCIKTSHFFGSPDASFELFELSTARSEYKKADKYILEAAQNGHVEAQLLTFYINNDLGNFLADTMALALLNEQNASAMIYLGERMLIKKHYEYAHKLFLAALENGKSSACGHLGYIWYHGFLQKKNVELANYYWKKGIEFHDPLSEYLYAIVQLNNAKDKNSYDYRRAIYYLVCSASHGLYLGHLKLSAIIGKAIDKSQTTDIVYISKALKCQSTKSYGHLDNLFHMKNDFEEACY